MISKIISFKNIFSSENLKDIYENQVSQTRATGVDNISTKIFERDLDSHLNLINRKVLNGSYKFSRYKQKLISKGAGKAPREVCIPTIRDRVVLKALNQFLQSALDEQVQQPLPQIITKQTKQALLNGSFDIVIKLDISDFYPSVQHDVLKGRLRLDVHHDVIVNLIENAITQSTGGEKNKKGVPQGLPISNILAALYLREIDIKYETRNDIFYRRYVDDILVFCKKENAALVSNEIVSVCSEIGLAVYKPEERPDKSSINDISKEFSYIGYRYNPKERESSLVSTRIESKQKLIDSLTGIFTSYHRSKSKSIALLQWRVNLRITGCISEGSGKGWVFFFSEIDDLKSLYELDKIVEKLCKRFAAPFPRKRFVRAWHEINNNRWRKNYFPNFDGYDTNSMSEVLATCRGVTKGELELTEDEIKNHFWRIIKKEIKDMETDIQDSKYRKK